MLRLVDSYTISVLGSAHSICMHQWVEVGMATELASYLCPCERCHIQGISLRGAIQRRVGWNFMMLQGRLIQ